MSSHARKVFSTCRSCGTRLPRPIFEVEDDFLERCPECGAYDWIPEPIKTGRAAVVEE